jgi:uncharacterized protein YwqG
MMDFFRRLFGWQDARAVRDVAALTAGVTVPAIRVAATRVPSRSHFGGSPNLPPDTPWPEKDGRRLGFLARISLEEMQSTEHIDWLPASGALLFFYDLEQQPWGFDPRDRGAAAVLLVPDLPQPIAQAGASAGDDALQIPFRNMAFERIEIIPGPERDAIRKLELSEKEIDVLFDLAERVFQGKPKHQLAGVPAPVQSDDMELECQLVTHGLYCGDPSGYDDPRAKTLAAGAASWKLLFQFDTDDDLGVMWGDCGMLYYWVESEAARTGDFRNAWLILQCS